jgi:type I restriction enzyme S subunit
LFAYEPIVKWLIDHAVGQTMLNLNTEILGSTPVVVPTFNEQREIAGALSSIEENLQSTRMEISALLDLKSALMSVLLTGEVRVRPDEEAAP